MRWNSNFIGQQCLTHYAPRFSPYSIHKTYGSCACLRTSLSLHTPTKTKAINAPSITSTLKMGMPMPYINDQFINSMRRLPWENKQENYQHQCNSKSKSIFTSIQDHFLPYQTIFILMHFILSQTRLNIKYHSINLKTKKKVSIH